MGNTAPPPTRESTSTPPPPAARSPVGSAHNTEGGGRSRRGGDDEGVRYLPFQGRQESSFEGFVCARAGTEGKVGGGRRMNARKLLDDGYVA